MPAPLPPLVKLSREIERLKLDNSNLRSLNKKLLRRGGGYDAFMEEFKELTTDEKQFKYKSLTKPFIIDPFDNKHVEIACVAVSDLHLSETVRKEDSNGINVYNSVVAANRLWEHAQKVKSILSRHMAMYRFDKIWVPMLGDMINGTIHPEMIISNDLTDPAAVILASRLLKMFLEELRPLGLPISIDAIHGNHPRLTAKMPTKRQAHTNLDWLVYEILADEYGADDQVDMSVHTGQIGQVKLFNHLYLFEHGISVRSGDEEGFEDRLRAVFDDPVYRESTGLKGASFDQVVIGNMHKAKFLERTIVNGTYTGQNELGMSWRLKPIRASQCMWGVSKKHSRTWQYQIDLTHIISERADNPMSEYASWFLKRHGK